MGRPQSIDDLELVRSIKESEFYNPTNGKWITNQEVRMGIANKYGVSQETIYRGIRRLVNEKILHPTEYLGVYFLDKKMMK